MASTAGFIRDVDGRIATFDVPGAAFTNVFKIDDRGPRAGGML